jgi:hypothetical protein
LECGGSLPFFPIARPRQSTHSTEACLGRRHFFNRCHSEAVLSEELAFAFALCLSHAPPLSPLTHRKGTACRAITELKSAAMKITQLPL